MVRYSIALALQVITASLPHALPFLATRHCSERFQRHGIVDHPLRHTGIIGVRTPAQVRMFHPGRPIVLCCGLRLSQPHLLERDRSAFSRQTISLRYRMFTWCHLPIRHIARISSLFWAATGSEPGRLHFTHLRSRGTSSEPIIQIRIRQS